MGDRTRALFSKYLLPGETIPDPPARNPVISFPAVEATEFAPIFSNLTGLGDPERVPGASVTWNFFGVLGTPISRGRAFVADDAKGPDPNVIVLGDGLWRRTFGGRPDVVGATVQLDGKPFTIVGIAPPDFRMPATAEFWQPLVFSPHNVAPQARGAKHRLAAGSALRASDAVE